MAPTKKVKGAAPSRVSTRDRKAPDYLKPSTATESGKGRGIKKVTKPAAKKSTSGKGRGRPSIKDKVDGAVKKVEGAVTKSPAAKKAATPKKKKESADGKKRGRPAAK